MESQLRTILYQQLSDRKIAYNPVEPEPFDLVDLTRDITNATRIYHQRTECVREALGGASLIVADSHSLANAVQQVLPRSIVVALPFAPLYVTPTQPNPEVVVGLLNHSGEMEQNNQYALKLLKALKQPLMIYGRELPGIEGEVKEDFNEFAALCDILLLPSLPGALNSTTLPLALMGSKTALLAHNAPGYASLAAATGVQLLPGDPAAWHSMVANLVSQPAKLKVMQERNQAYAVRQNRGSYAHLAQLAGQFTTPPPSLRSQTGEGCGCAKKKAEGGRRKDESEDSSLHPSSFILHPSPEPDLDQPTIEKES
jgi:glycosyltransferase involved in cell wall biosynthesis